MEAHRDEQDEHAHALSEHKKLFDAIIVKYGLASERNSSKIADFLSSSERGTVTSEEFATEFGMDKMEAIVFLSWINIGVQFKNQFLTPADL